MKEGFDYLEELLGSWYFNDSEARGEVPINIRTDEIYRVPETQLTIVNIPEGGKRDYLEKICKVRGKSLNDYLVIRAICPWHGEFEVFRPLVEGARYNNVFCPKCIRHEQLLVDCERYLRNGERLKAEKQTEKGKSK